MLATLQVRSALILDFSFAEHCSQEFSVTYGYRISLDG
jgi:hypothetical protein